MNTGFDEPPVPDLDARLERLEEELTRLTRELAEVRALAAVARPEASTSAAEPRAEPLAEPQPVAPDVPAPAPPPYWPPPRPPKPPTRAEEAREPSAARELVSTTPGPPSGPARRTLGELARDWDLVGPRGFAVAGGAVTALGIGLFFVLAANRGWIDPTARVLLGAVASALVLGAGLLLRARFGQYLSALAAVGAGIAGGYATLAAAAARYDLVPDGLALPLAGAIAAVATAIALRWRSQIIAAIGLLGAALAPALQALDTHLSWESAAFAVIVFAAAVAVSLLFEWHRLALATALLVGAQCEWLVEDANVRAGAGTAAVVATYVGLLIATSIGRQLLRGRGELAPSALGYALAAMGLTFLFAIQLFDDRTIRGSALLLAAGVWALAFLGLQARRYPDLALVMGTSALAVAAVGTADLISDAALTLAWAAEAVVFAFVASRLRDARLQATSLVYAVLSAGHALAAEGRLDHLFDRNADHLQAVLPLAAAAVGFAASGVLARGEYEKRTEIGLLAFLAEVRTTLAAHHRGLREAALVAAALLGTLAGSFALVDISFDWGHVGASALAAVVGAGILVVSGRRRSDPLAFAAYYWLGVVVGVSVVFDVPDVTRGGWAALAAAAALLGGSYVHRLAHSESRARDVVLGVAAGIAALTAAIGIDDLTDDRVAGGLALLAAAAVYIALAARIFRMPALRDVSTTLWALGLLFVLGGEAVLLDSGSATTFAAALTGAGVALLAQPLGESRFWTAGTVVAGTATAATLSFFTPPSHLFTASVRPASGVWVLLACLVAIAVLALTSLVPPHRSLLYALGGALGLYALSLGFLDVAERVSTASISTDFERGHTAVSALWALVGLALLLAGVLRGSAVVRYAGLALFGLTLAKIFLYDLAELSSIARAFSFILVGGLLLTGGFFLQRLSDRVGPSSSS